MKILGKIMSIDFGLKRVGISISDEFGFSIKIFKNIVFKTKKSNINIFLNIAIKEKVSKILIGYPFLDETFSENVIYHRIKLMYNKLINKIKKKKLIINVLLVDESFTSVNAFNILNFKKISKKRINLKINGESARIILKNYIY